MMKKLYKPRITIE